MFDHRARQFSPTDFDRFDLIVVMDEENYCDVTRQMRSEADRKKVVRIRDYFRSHAGQQTVPDPYYGTDRDFDFAVELLEDACAGLLDAVTGLDCR